LLELVVLAGRPRALSVFASALERTPEELVVSVATLRAGRLVSTGQSGRLRCFHDRVRQAISALTHRDVARARHAQLAAALENLPDGEFHAAVHFQQAGEVARALPLFERAAQKAVTALAFERAAALYARMLSIGEAGREPAWAQSLRVQRAHALAHAGRSVDAARAFLDAAERCEGDESLELRCWAAQHLLQGAQVREGIAVLSEISERMDLGLPSGSKSAFLKLLWHRTLLGMRGLKSTPKDASEVAPDVLKRLDLIHAVSPGLTWIDIFRGAELGARHLRLSLSSGERQHTTMALAAEALTRGIQGRDVPDSAWDLIDRAQALARHVREPEPRAFVHMSRGQLMQCQWRSADAIQELERAEQLYAERW
jgi:hypothetical protein